MNQLELLIRRQLKDRQMTRGQLAVALGYQNIGKGLRRVDAYAETLGDPAGLRAQLPQLLGISAEALGKAEQSVRRYQHQEAVRKHCPFVELRLVHAPRPIVIAGFMGSLYRSRIPKAWRELPFAEEIQLVSEQCNQLGTHYESRTGELPAALTPPWAGFRYVRGYDQSLSFDKQGRLESTSQNPVTGPALSVTIRKRDVSALQLNEIIGK